LKPDAYRRVEGRLPSPGSKAGMAPPLSLLLLASLPLSKQRSREEKVRGGLSCEIVRTNTRIRFSRLARST
jgi:hypothetical protein